MAIRLTPAQAAKLGIESGPAPKPVPGSHEAIVATYSDRLLEAVFADLGKRNLRDYSDHFIRWQAERLSAIRAERRRRNPKKGQCSTGTTQSRRHPARAGKGMESAAPTMSGAGERGRPTLPGNPRKP